MLFKENGHRSVDIGCDGSRCPDYNIVVPPEIIGSGDIQVGIMAEAPYVNESEIGRPLVGSSGQELREYFDLDYCTYYIFNTLMCLTYRDGETRKPSQMEYDEYHDRFAKCEMFREQVLDLLDDGSVVIAFGKFAIAGLFGDFKRKASITPVFLDWKDKTFIAYGCLHPAYMLYRPSARVDFEAILEASGMFKLPEEENIVS